MFKCQVEFCPYFYIQAKVASCARTFCRNLLQRQTN